MSSVVSGKRWKWTQVGESETISPLTAEVKDLLMNVEGLEHSKDATVNERKAIRTKKLAEFKDQTEKILGASFEETAWKHNNKDDEKKEVTKIFERRVSKELNLPNVAD